MHDLLLAIYIVVAIISAFLLKRTDGAFRYVALYIIFTAITEWLSIILIKIFRSNTIALNGFVVIMVFLYYFIFKKLWARDKYWNVQNGFFITVIVSLIATTFFFKNKDDFPWIQILMLSLIIIYNSLLVLRQMLDEPVETSIFRQSKFWLCSIVFIYYACTFFYWCMYNLLNNEALDYMMMFNTILCCVFYPVLTYSVYLNTIENKQSSIGG